MLLFRMNILWLATIKQRNNFKMFCRFYVFASLIQVLSLNGDVLICKMNNMEGQYH